MGRRRDSTDTGQRGQSNESGQLTHDRYGWYLTDCGMGGLYSRSQGGLSDSLTEGRGVEMWTECRRVVEQTEAGRRQSGWDVAVKEVCRFAELQNCRIAELQKLKRVTQVL
jgi:hypothetical protein